MVVDHRQLRGVPDDTERAHERVVREDRPARGGEVEDRRARQPVVPVDGVAVQEGENRVPGDRVHTRILQQVLQHGILGHPGETGRELAGVGGEVRRPLHRPRPLADRPARRKLAQLPLESNGFVTRRLADGQPVPLAGDHRQAVRVPADLLGDQQVPRRRQVDRTVLDRRCGPDETIRHPRPRVDAVIPQILHHLAQIVLPQTEVAGDELQHLSLRPSSRVGQLT